MICCVLRVVVSSVGRVRGGVGAYVEIEGGAAYCVVVLVEEGMELLLLPPAVLLVAGVLFGFLGMSTGRTVRRGGNSSRTVPGTGTLIISSSESPKKSRGGGLAFPLSLWLLCRRHSPSPLISTCGVLMLG